MVTILKPPSFNLSINPSRVIGGRHWLTYAAWTHNSILSSCKNRVVALDMLRHRRFPLVRHKRYALN